MRDLARRVREQQKRQWAPELARIRAEAPYPSKPMIPWVIGGTVYDCEILPQPCPHCGERTLMALPPPALAQQPDRTNVVCNPVFGGCNQGFEYVPPKVGPS